jgi:predicted alpha/beta superfamily hydrolase
MNKLILIFFLSLPFSGFSQNKKIEIGIVDSLYSKILNEVQEIWVHVPSRPKEHEVFAPKRYPVVYLLDGELNFQSVTGMVNYLSIDSENGNGVTPEVIVVGIISKNRTRDFTPSNITKLWNGKEERYLRPSGGGEKFLTYMEKELIPYIDSHYPTQPHRTIIGHSFGGLFAVNALVKKPYLFNSYVCIEPSLWWDNNLLFNKATDALKEGKFKGKKIFLAIADTVLVKNESGGNIDHVRSNMKFANMLQNHKNAPSSWYSKYYKGENHFTVLFIAEYEGLQQIFKHKSLQVPEAGVADPGFHANFLKQHYTDLSNELGYKFLPPEYLTNNLGLACMYQNLMDKAYNFFRLNMDNYPESFNVYNSMGNYYVKQGNKKKAVEFYTKALSIKDYPETKQKIQELKNSK